MLTSTAPNGTPQAERPKEFIVVPIDDKWEPRIGDELRSRETDSVRRITRVVAGIGFEYVSGGASFTTYPQEGSYAKAIARFECFRPVAAAPPTITLSLEESTINEIRRTKNLSPIGPAIHPAVTITQKPVNPYMRRLPGVVTDAGGVVCGDIYTFILAYEVTCPATQHALKKLACAGTRGSKSREQDLREALAAIQRAIEIETGKS